MPRNYGLYDPGRKSDRMGADGQLLTRSSHVELLYACLIRHTQKGVDLCPEKWGGHPDNNATAGVFNGGPATRRTRFDEEEPLPFRWLLTVREMNDLSHDAPPPSNARLRDELLDGEIFYTPREAQIVIESWRRHYNAARPHAALGYKAPAPEVFVPALAALPAPQPRPAPPAMLPVAPRPTLN